MKHIFAAIATSLLLLTLRTEAQNIVIREVGNAPAGAVKLSAANPDTVKKIRYSGLVTDEQGRGIAFANVALRDIKSKALFGTSCDKDGRFSILVPPGAYMAEFSCIGYDRIKQPTVITTDTEAKPLALKVAQQEIAALTVKGSSIEYNAKGYSLNVGANPLYKGHDLTEVLATAPGMVVTDDEIKVFDNKLHKVYIDDRVVSMNGPTLMQYLKSYMSDNVRSIEVIASSGVDEDAAAMGQAIIRITTKRQQSGGFASIIGTGNIGEGYTSGLTGTMDMRTGKFTIYSHIQMPIASKIISGQETYLEDLVRGTVSSSTSERVDRKTLSSGGATLGFGYDFSDHDLLTVEGNVDIGKTTPFGTATASEISEATTLLRKEFYAARRYDNSARVKAYYIHRFDNKGRLSLDGDYQTRLYKNYDRYDYTSSGGVDPERAWRDTDDTRRESYSWSMCGRYYTPIRGGKDQLSAGLKYALISNSNTRDIGVWGDTELSSRTPQQDLFDYDEAIAAAFANYNGTFGRWKLTAGLRIEHTQTEIRTANDTYGNGYTGLYPDLSLAFDLNKNKGHMITAGYTRSIKRPSMNSLNPNVYFESLDYYTVGNPHLRASDNNRLQMRFVAAHRYTLSAYYDFSDNGVDRITGLDENGLLYSKSENLASSRRASVSLSAPVTLFKRLMLNPSVSYAYTRLKYDGTINARHSAGLSLMAMCNLPQSFSVRVVGLWSSSSVTGNSRNSIAAPLVTLSASKNLFRDALIISVNLADPFNSLHFDSKTEGERFRSVTSNRISARSISMIVRYNIRWGDRKVRIEHAQASGSEGGRL